jgi:hypothetical protein
MGVQADISANSPSRHITETDTRVVLMHAIINSLHKFFDMTLPSGVTT